MSDDRWNSDDERAPFLDRAPPPGVRPFWKQPDRRGPPTPEEIAEFIAKEFPETQKSKRRLIRPPGWDPEPEKGDAYEPPDNSDQRERYP